MRALFSILILLSTTSLSATNQITSHGTGADRFWLIHDDSANTQVRELVVFVHGYAAANPACYGQWIEAITQRGYVVLFPKYQTGTWLPRTRVFQERVHENIRAAQPLIAQQFGWTVESIHFVAHSLGGIISANLAQLYSQAQSPHLKSMTLIQPGYKYLKLGRQDSYADLTADVPVILLTSDNDRTSGQRFAKHLYQTSPQLAHKVHLHQSSSKYDGQKVRANHIVPIAVSKALDTGNRNIIIWVNLWFGKTNVIDEQVIWRLTQANLAASNDTAATAALFSDAEQLTYSGTWPDGTSLPELTIVQ
ncbi:MAG: alpha/beta fold hydrolase [Bacteroidota bacterium]